MFYILRNTDNMTKLCHIALVFYELNDTFHEVQVSQKSKCNTFCILIADMINDYVRSFSCFGSLGRPPLFVDLFYLHSE